MKIIKDGWDFSFDTTICNSCDGNCCIGESGYIWISIKEIEKLASYLNLPIKEVFLKYINKIDYKFSLKEVYISKNNYRCIFFNMDKKQCDIYEVRPTQCKTYPFWDRFKKYKSEVIKECPAIVLE